MSDDVNVRIIVELPRHLLREITQHRFVRRLPSRAEAIRRLLTSGLASAATEPVAATSRE